jgi:hypothetical protein
MTVAYDTVNPHTLDRVNVPQEILYYCDDVTVDADRLDLRYLDCVYMHMGYYGNDPDVLKQYRNEYYSKPRPVFE